MQSWPVGTNLRQGEYQIVDILGHGGFGITYLALECATQKQVAIKSLNTIVQSKPDFAQHQERFVQEAFMLAGCNHKHIIKVHKVFQEANLWCMVMDYIDGINLAEYIEDHGIFSEADALKYIQQIGSALDYFHNQKQSLHRDVKPQNILLIESQQKVVLIDFGLAREFTQDKTKTHTNSLTESYAPIEQYQLKAKRGAYTDVYALAATLYYCLTAQEPFPAKFRTQGINLIPPKQHNPNISDSVSQAILKGMELEAENRPSTMREWLILLGKAAINLPVIPVNQAPLPQVKIPNQISQRVSASERPTLLIDIPDGEIIKPVNLPLQPPETQPKQPANSPLAKAEINQRKPVNLPLQPSETQPKQPANSPLPKAEINQRKPVNLPLQPPETKIIQPVNLPFKNPEIKPNQPVNSIINQPEIKSTESVTLDLEQLTQFDYNKLEELLAKNHWKEADQETLNLMLTISNREKEGWLDIDTCKIFPQQELRLIDQLWVKYSHGRFGFSIQKEILILCGGIPGAYDSQMERKFGDHVGWRKRRNWVSYSDLVFDLKAPKGHLPIVRFWIVVWGSRSGRVSALASRL
jgi:eukaryotic-like serine/threonine-protein kinase